MSTTDAVLPLTLLASASGARTWAGVAAPEPRTGIPALAVGGLTSLSSAHVTYRIRRALMKRMPAFAAAAVEDVTVIATAAAGALLMRRP